MSSNKIIHNETYDMLLKLVRTRHSVRKFKPDPVPEDTIDKILEVARWAMSGANSQPWEFIVVTDPKTKKELRDAYSEYNTDFIFWMEQQREYNLRHPSYQVKNDPHESLRFNKAKANWHQAPAVIVVLGGVLSMVTVILAVVVVRFEVSVARAAIVAVPSASVTEFQLKL